MADLLANQAIRGIHSSPSPRAVQTVQPLADRLGLSIQVEPDLRERQLADGPVAHFDDAVEATWRDFDFTHPGGESNRAARARVSRAIARIVWDAGDRGIAIASHGNAIALFLYGDDPRRGFEFWAGLSMPDIYAVDVRVGYSSLRRVWST